MYKGMLTGLTVYTLYHYNDSQFQVCSFPLLACFLIMRNYFHGNQELSEVIFA